ncbi:MAG: hypothetical protein J6C54_04060 [Lachnospiraceae bacterium]|nr:hypothetical protein [Lachnospiraceae bacterium]
MEENLKMQQGELDIPESCDVNLSDFALFLSVMKVKEAYQCTLSIALDEADLELEEVKVEQVILNKTGNRAIRLDAWALDKKNRQINTEMQNNTDSDDVKKRSRFYQGLMDTPILKAGKETRYKHLPATIIIFITQADIFGKDLACYTFTEQCEEVAGLHLDDGTKKIFLNMTSKNGRPELVSLLQYMRDTRMNNPEVKVKDERIVRLDEIVQEVKQSEEWEAVKMNLLEIGEARGEARGEEKKLIRQVCKKLSKGKAPDVIAEELEEDLAVIAKICEAASEFAPEYDCDKVYEKLHFSK